MQRAGQRERSGAPGVIAGVRGNVQDQVANSASPKSLTTSRTQEGPPPLAVMPMLGLTRTPGQANAGQGVYDFSLEYLLIVPIFQAFEGHPPETVNL